MSYGSEINVKCKIEKLVIAQATPEVSVVVCWQQVPAYYNCEDTVNVLNVFDHASKQI